MITSSRTNPRTMKIPLVSMSLRQVREEAAKEMKQKSFFGKKFVKVRLSCVSPTPVDFCESPALP